MENSLFNSTLDGRRLGIVSTFCCYLRRLRLLLIVFSRCLATTRARANKTKTHDTPAKWILIVGSSFAKSQAFFYLSADDAFLEENTKIPFVSLRGSHSVDDPAFAGVGSWLEPQLFHKTEWNKKNVEYYARPLRENRFFVYQLWVFVWASACSLYTSAVYKPQLHNLSLSTRHRQLTTLISANATVLIRVGPLEPRKLCF